MKILIAYHSRSGNNEKLAKILAGKLNADLEEVTSSNHKKITSAIEFIKEGLMSSMHISPKIKLTVNEPSDYDLVIICTPVRAGNLPGQMRTYLKNNAFRFNKISYISACAA